MKKTISSILVFFFLIQTIIHIPVNSLPEESYTMSICFSNAETVMNQTQTFIHIDNLSQHASMPGDYLRPTSVETFTYPFGTIIDHVEVAFSQPQRLALSSSLAVKQTPQTTYDQKTIAFSEKETNDSLAASYDYMVDVGIKNKQRVVYLTVFISPVSYDAENRQALVYSEADITIQTKSAANPLMIPDEYDMVIITTESFSQNVRPLIDHKNSMEIKTYMKTCEEIYTQYEGRDKAEQIKYFIKDAIESNGISYVLLIGGRKGGLFEETWSVPVRYAQVDDNAETSYITDLYYADIYNETGEFASWDTNDNGIIAEWTRLKKDELGLIPDVYLGRLPCRTKREVDIMVEKIKTYETTDKTSWFYDMVVVGGDSAPGDQFNEGEEENKQALLYMDNFTGIHCWTSDQSFTGPEDVMNAINPGCGFLFFDGHANPASWSTHPPGDKKTWIHGLSISDMPLLENGNKHPICVVGGCHIAQFNVSLLNLFRDIIKYGPVGYFFKPPLKFYHMEWVPRCWSWQLASMKEGGSIATLGYTGLDWFAVGDDDNDGIPDCTQYYSGFMNTHFFKNYGQNNIHVLGEIHTQTIIDYIMVHPPMSFVLDCKTVQEFVLLGDPSLQLVASP